ncbi:hypothetical protein [Accumulibacter sp.]|nr:hypothetical protein [Accumulibacter sp.]
MPQLRLLHCLLGSLCWATIPVWAGGSNYGIAAGALPQIAGKVSE